jgi:signal transduction histidine kinase
LSLARDWRPRISVDQHFSFMVRMSRSVSSGYAELIAERMAGASQQIAKRWLDRLAELLPVDTGAIFPSTQLLDHIPLLIEQIAAYLRAPAGEEIAANTAVIEKAQELGHLRHQQQASVHQILREYDILADLLEEFVFNETATLPEADALGLNCLGLTQRLGHAVRTLMQTTTDTFVGQYTATIADQTARIESFNRMLMHELRTPLGTLLFAAELLTRSATTDNRESLTRVAALIRRNLEHVIGSLRGLERLVFPGRLIEAPNRQHVGVASIAAEVARQLAEVATARDVEIRVDPQLPELVTDAGQLELVLMNLVSNSIKYSDPAKASRYVEIAPVNSEAPESWTICVRDNGLGIPRALLGSIFKRYFRGHQRQDAELGIEGSGLGLAIVEESIRILGGQVRVQSEEGEGTTVYLTLPTGPVEDTPVPTPDGS